MKYKRRWSWTKAQLRNSRKNLNISSYDRWWRLPAPVKYNHSSRRAIERQNIQKIFTGEDPDLMHWPTKWHRVVDYYY